MVRLERQMTHTLKAAGGLAAATLALALLISWCDRQSLGKEDEM